MSRTDNRLNVIFNSVDEQKKLFEIQNSMNSDKPFVFYEGPPFATGTPHYGHILNGIIKDSVCRWKFAEGYNVPRNAGWDCHGLPIENKMEDKYNIKSKYEIEQFGIDKYNECCRSMVFQCVDSWKDMASKIGRWIDFDNDYKTMSTEYMECVWNVFKRIYDKNMVYRGFRVMPYSVSLSTPLSNFEAGSNYKDTIDICATVKFKLITDNLALKNLNINVLVWTTTPWTLPSNTALAVNSKLIYIIFTNLKSSENYLCTQHYFETNINKDENTCSLTVSGDVLVGSSYSPLFSYNNKTSNYRILDGEFVTSEKGTGIVHIAPAFGEDDFNLCISSNIINKEFTNLFMPVDDNGKFTDEVPELKGQLVFDTNDEICKMLKEAGLLFKKESITHSYPYCWRSDTKLMYRAVDSWFIKVSEITEDLVKNNREVNWVPDYVGKQRFNNWLENARDWNFSRKRYWGCTIPIWYNVENKNDIIVIGSIDELYKYSGIKIDDLHRDIVDNIEFDYDNKHYKRIEDVMDCWFESGAMPYAKDGILNPPLRQAEFICEGLDQTRGWFYTLLVISTILDNKAPYKNVIVNGLVLASDGKKMSKRLKNYPDPNEIIEKYGSDALRFYLLFSNASYGNPVSFKDIEVKSICSNVIFGLFNTCKFYKDYLQVALSKDFKFSENFKTSSNISDIWISDITLQLFSDLSSKIEKYEFKGLGDLIQLYVDKLNNTYIRFNRNRFRNCDYEAIHTLHHVLHNLSIILAPFTPFISEYMYSILGNNDSVHNKLHSDIVNYSSFNSELNHSFNILIELVDNIRRFRSKNNLRAQIPIKELKIVIDSELQTDYNIGRINNIMYYLKEECNILNINVSLEANLFKISGYTADYKKYKHILDGKLINQALNDIRKNNKLEESYYDNEGNKLTIELGKHIIRKVDLNKKYVKNKSGFAISDSRVYLDFNTEIDSNTEKLYYRNQVLAYVQQFRKSKSYNLEDLLSIVILTDSENFQFISELIPETYQNSNLEVDIINENINDSYILDTLDKRSILFYIKACRRKDSYESLKTT